MIDTTTPHPPLTGQWTKVAFAVSFGLFVLLPLLAALCYVIGAVLWGGCVLWIALVHVVLYGIALLPVLLGVVVAFGAGEMKGSNQAGDGCGCGIMIAIFVGFPLTRYAVLEFAEPNASPIRKGTYQIATDLFDKADDAGRAVFGAYTGYDLYAWPWLLLALAVAVTLGFVGVLLFARSDAVIRRTAGRVRYRCPRCAATEPAFGCPNCGATHTDLSPTRHGFWAAGCGHCKTPLGTTGWSGRLNLPKTCAACKGRIDHPEVGRLPEVHLGVVGPPGCGKTSLLLAALSEMGAVDGLTVVAGGATDDREFGYRLAKWKGGTVPDPTPRSARPAADTLAVRRGGDGCLLYLYDVSGHDLCAGSDGAGGFAEHDYHRLLDGVLLVIDPYAEGLVRPGADMPRAVPAHEVLSHLFRFWQRERGVAASGRFRIPVAVAVAKLDAVPGDNDGVYADLSARPLDQAVAAAADRSDQVRRRLTEAGCGDLLQLLESHCADIRYFGTSAMGRTPRAGDRGGFAARGATAPLLWLLARSGGLGGPPAAVKAARRVTEHWGRSLRGLEGAAALRAGWWAACGVAVVVGGLVAAGIGTITGLVAAWAVLAAALLLRVTVRR